MVRAATKTFYQETKCCMLTTKSYNKVICKWYGYQYDFKAEVSLKVEA